LSSTLVPNIFGITTVTEEVVMGLEPATL